MKEPQLSSLPPFSDYIPQINWEKISDAILGGEGAPKLADYDYTEAKQMVWAAAEKWLVKDFYDIEFTGVEEMYEETLDLPGVGLQRFKGIKDLRGILRGRLNTTKKLGGKKVVLDWKTTSNVTFPAEWEDRLLDSWQWKKYLYFDQAEVMIYRGLNRQGKTKELMIERPANLEADVLAQITGVALQRKALVDAGITVWPRRMPGSCGAFGRECPYQGDCRDMTMPLVAIEPGKSLSYSSMDKFLLCPERSRRELLYGEAEDTEESIFGQRVHLGLAELYNQARSIFGTT